MGRQKLLKPDELSEEQRAVYQGLTEGERGKNANLVNADGSLIGPFNAMLFSPLTGDRFQSLGESLRYFNKLPANQLEVVILVIAAEWRAEFEWWAHERLARKAGVEDAVIASIKRKQRPDFINQGEALVYDIATELLVAHRLSDQTFERAISGLGEAGLMDLQFLMAYYTGVSMVLNTFEIPLPEGVESQF